MIEGSVAYQRRERLIEEARAYKAEGHTHEEVAKRFGKSYEWSRKYCKGVAPQPNQYMRGDYDRIANAKRIITKHYPNFEYVSGFVDVDSPVIIRCKICGTERTASMVSLRHNSTVTCKECTRVAKEMQKAAETMQKESQRFNRGKQVSIKLCFCEVCGALYFPASLNQKYCESCSTQVRNKYYSMKKRNRKALAWTPESNLITLSALYKRDNGVCWICGQACDFEADSNDNNYPSIDHVMPISKGGKDAWNNVKLAHRYCNSKRRDTSPV